MRMQSGVQGPNLVVIGAQKCGTTSLHRYLDLHPEIEMSAVKETNFFLDDGAWDRGLDFFDSQFTGLTKIRGEASPDYTNLPHSEGTAQRVREVIPDARLIYLVRDPFARLESGYLHARAAGTESRTFREAVTAVDNTHLARSMYATQLGPFLEAFPRDQILVESQERLLTHRRTALRRIFRFLEVGDRFDTDEFDRRWEESRGKGTAYMAAWRLAQRGVRVPGFLRWPAQRVLRSSVAGPKLERPVADEELREQLLPVLAPEVRRLRAITELKFSEWSL